MKPYKMFETTNEHPAICGHRGAPAVAPENTLGGFAAAKDLGARWLEFDVRPTADRDLVVHHDPVTAEGHDIGATETTELPEYIPLLAEVVEQFSDLILDIELKTDDTGLDAQGYVDVAAPAINALTEQHSAVQVLVTSFDADALRLFAERCPNIATGFLYYLDADDPQDAERDAANMTALQQAVEAGHQAVVPHHPLVTPHMVTAAHEQGLHVATWTVNTLEDTLRCAQAGVDVIIGDDPRVIANGLQSLLD